VNFSKNGAIIDGFEYQDFSKFISNLSFKLVAESGTVNVLKENFNAKPKLKKLLRKHEREIKLFEKFLKKASKKLQSDQDLVKENEKMLELLKDNNFLSLTFKLDIEILLRQTRRVDLGEASKTSKLTFFKSIINKTEMLKRELVFTNKMLEKT